MKRKEYVYLLSDTDRKRHIHSRTEREITDFLVQYEVLIDGEWRPVVRYDTAHGYAHKDILNPDGSKQKVILGAYSYEAALTFADLDINQNWKAYKAKVYEEARNLMEMEYDELFTKNQRLSTEFDLYITEHPEMEAQIPDNALIVLLPEYDKGLGRKNMELALRHREPGQPVVYVRIDKLRTSRLEGLQLQVA